MKKAFVNARIFTADEKNKWAEAVIINQNKIEFVGTNTEAEKVIDDNTEVIDLEGKLILPGFIDSHAHIIMGGFFLLSVNLTGISSRTEFINELNNYVNKNRGKWITGGNWNHQAWDPVELPRREWIDGFSKATPIFINRMDYHMAFANSFALKLAGITKDTPEPDGGKIDKDALTSEPTGILRDKAMELVYNVIPEPKESELIKAGLAAMKEAKRLGVTSIQDITYKNDFKTYQKLERDGNLTCRVYTRLPIVNYKDLIHSEFQFGFGSSKLKVGSLKAFADGSLGSSTALFSDSYADDPENKGLAMDILSNGDLEKWALLSDKNKLQLSIHAIGDKAISKVIDIAEKINKENPLWHRRFRIEHGQHMTKEDMTRCADLGIIVSAQPYQLYDDGAWAEKKVGKERLQNMYAFNSLLNAGVKLCFGSDWSVSTMDPIAGIHTAVTRQTADGKNPGGLIPEEKLTVEEAVNCYTINASYASFEENIKGSIQVGKLADMVILSENIFEIEPAEIINTKVLTTIFDGNIIYQH